MKRITLLFIAIIACLLSVEAQVDTTQVVEQQVTETGIEYVDTPAPAKKGKKINLDFGDSFSGGLGTGEVISIVAIFCVFGMPVVIVFLAFFFKYKNKRAKYKLAEQALAAGQPIPQEFYSGAKENGVQQKGITNTFTGIGLFIFLWAITGEFSIGCIGLLVMFTGLGQIVVHYTQKNKEEDRKRFHNDNNPTIEG